jgi:tripartite-type tricarboxylate transporter receptor subunit TctC
MPHRAAAQAGTLPQTVRLVVPFPPGNAADIQARALADHLRKALGITVVVDNRPGASGAIALQYVAHAKPDGATLMVASLSPLVITPASNKSLLYDTERDFAPIALLGFNDVVLLAGPSAPVNTVAELVELAKKQPDELTYASIGNGTLAHLVMELICSRAGVRMRHVPYKGSGQAYNDLMGGQVSLMIDGMPQSLPLITANRFKPLAIFSKERSPFAKNLPTMKETNNPSLQTIEVLGWTGFLAPAGTPRSIITQLNAETNRILGSAEMRSFLATQSLQPFPAHSPEDFAAYIRTELARWRDVAKAAGVEGAKE